MQLISGFILKLVKLNTGQEIIDGVEHINISDSGIEVSPEFWIGRFLK